MKEKLRRVREQLLQLHTLLLADQKHEYQQTIAQINGPGDMLNLVMNHEHFAWLRALSALIVRMDELLDPKGEWSDSEAKTQLEYTEALLVPATEGAVFRQK